MTMKPEDYDAWYRQPRGRSIGETEFALLKTMLQPETDASLIDIGCGTGYFTRLFARDLSGEVVGIDPDEESLRFARAQALRGERYENALGESLPFADQAFDFSVSVAALCFIPDERRVVTEMLRVTRKRFAIGLLNRHSLLWRQKGRDGGKGAYQGAHWHTAAEARALFAGLPVANFKFAAPSCCRAAAGRRGWWSAYGCDRGCPARFLPYRARSSAQAENPAEGFAQAPIMSLPAWAEMKSPFSLSE